MLRTRMTTRARLGGGVGRGGGTFVFFSKKPFLVEA